jgi:hypothetical protein
MAYFQGQQVNLPEGISQILGFSPETPPFFFGVLGAKAWRLAQHLRNALPQLRGQLRFGGVGRTVELHQGVLEPG